MISLVISIKSFVIQSTKIYNCVSRLFNLQNMLILQISTDLEAECAIFKKVVGETLQNSFGVIWKLYCNMQKEALRILPILLQLFSSYGKKQKFHFLSIIFIQICT